jgi:hypothetical protein
MEWTTIEEDECYVAALSHKASSFGSYHKIAYYGIMVMDIGKIWVEILLLKHLL